MIKLKKLEWSKVYGSDNSWFACSQSSRTGCLYLVLEEEGFFPSWSFTEGPFKTFKEAKDSGQKHHEEWLKHFLEFVD